MKPILTLLTVLLLAPPVALHAEDKPTKKPNVVVIVADDLGYADVSFNPQHPKEVSTPHLDALAKAGVICRQGYVKLILHVTIPANTTATIIVPAKSADAIAESGKPLAKAPGVKFLRMDGDRAVLEAEAGSYRFATAMK
jgi:hypothetical protein